MEAADHGPIGTSSGTLVNPVLKLQAPHTFTSPTTIQTGRSIRSKQSPRQQSILKTLSKSSYRRALEAATIPRSNRVDNVTMQGFEPIECFSAIQNCQKPSPTSSNRCTHFTPYDVGTRSYTGKKNGAETWLETENLGPDRIGTIGGYIALAAGSESNLTYLRISPPSWRIVSSGWNSPSPSCKQQCNMAPKPRSSGKPLRCSRLKRLHTSRSRSGGYEQQRHPGHHFPSSLWAWSKGTDTNTSFIRTYMYR